MVAACKQPVEHGAQFRVQHEGVVGDAFGDDLRERLQTSILPGAGDMTASSGVGRVLATKAGGVVCQPLRLETTSRGHGQEGQALTRAMRRPEPSGKASAGAQPSVDDNG